MEINDHRLQYNAQLAVDSFRRKERFHRQQARLPIEKKIERLVELQKIALTIRPRRGPDDRRRVWVLT